MKNNYLEKRNQVLREYKEIKEHFHLFILTFIECPFKEFTYELENAFTSKEVDKKLSKISNEIKEDKNTDIATIDSAIACNNLILNIKRNKRYYKEIILVIDDDIDKLLVDLQKNSNFSIIKIQLEKIYKDFVDLMFVMRIVKDCLGDSPFYCFMLDSILAFIGRSMLVLEDFVS